MFGCIKDDSNVLYNVSLGCWTVESTYENHANLMCQNFILKYTLTHNVMLHNMTWVISIMGKSGSTVA